MTYGEKAVGMSFNPSQLPEVKIIKQMFADIIDICHNQRFYAPEDEAKRLFSVAITEAQTAQMWAVKALTYT